MSVAFSSQPRTPRQSLQEYGRGLAGGLIFSLPLLFTMEVWEAGAFLHPMRLLLYIGATFVLLLLYNRFVGLRREASFVEVMIDSVEELGLGLLTAALFLWLFGEISLEFGFAENLGKIVLEGMTSAIGFSIGTAQLGEGGANSAAGTGMERDDPQRGFLAQQAIALCGAVIFVSNVAPTEEVLLIAIGAATWKLGLIVLLSLVLCGGVLYFYEFRGSEQGISRDASWPEIMRGVVSTYAIALLTAAAALYFFGRFDNETPLVMLRQTVVAGFPAAIGASAGRLLLQIEDDDEDDSDEA